MSLTQDTLRKFILIGDRVLIRPKTSEGKTRSGLILPPGVEEKEEVQSWLILKTGPGIAVGPIDDDNEDWKTNEQDAKYIPLKVKEGDTAFYLQSKALEVEFYRKKYVIVPQMAILMAIRN